VRAARRCGACVQRAAVLCWMLFAALAAGGQIETAAAQAASRLGASAMAAATSWRQRISALRQRAIKRISASYNAGAALSGVVWLADG